MLKCNCLVLALPFAVFLSFPVHAAEDEVAAKRLFESYLKAGTSYDPAIADLYADDALIHLSKLDENNLPHKEKITAAQNRAMTPDVMKMAAENQLKIDYDKVSYAVLPEGGVRAVAEVYYHSLCYRDDRYSMVMAKDGTGTYKIKAEYIQLPMESRCEKK
jgi:hypothetical protein